MSPPESLRPSPLPEDLVAPPRLVIAGTASGVGKTTLTLALIAALRARGLAVAPFKVGPDYIDPSYHALAAGRPCRNLDSWLVPPERLPGLLTGGSAGADVAIIEGVLGLYDGRLSEQGEGSTAQVAALVRAPVVLVLDVSRQARSAAAVARGFQLFEPGVNLVGFILNRVGSDRHASYVRREVETATGLPVLGMLRRDDEVSLPERHLGLVPPGELERVSDRVERLAMLADRSLEVEALLKLARGAEPLQTDDTVFPRRAVREDAPLLAVARDAAFSFYYPENLELLEAFGARLAFFSPLEDRALPSGTRGLYLGGGFPELFAEKLAGNGPMLRAIREAAAARLPIYAECGGFIYLAKTLTDFDSRSHTLAGLAPFELELGKRRAALRYVRCQTLLDTPLAPAGRELRGHEFHWSAIVKGAERQNAYKVLEPERARAGFADETLLASFIHLHFAGDPSLPCGLVASLPH